MAAGDFLQKYAASGTLTVSGLHSLPTSSTHVSGWSSAEISNTSDSHEDKTISGKFTVGTPSVDPAEIRVWIVPKIGDSLWPGSFDGTEGQKTSPLNDANGTLAGAYLLKAIQTDGTGAQVYNLAPQSILTRLGFMPEKFVVFVTQSTGVNFAGSGNEVHAKGYYRNVAA